MNTHQDFLPFTAQVSTLARRIAMRLSSALAENGHKPITTEEGAALLNLADASQMLDRLATLPGMAAAEERARRDLLELYDIFHPFDPLEATQEIPDAPWLQVARS